MDNKFTQNYTLIPTSIPMEFHLKKRIKKTKFSKGQQKEKQKSTFSWLCSIQVQLQSHPKISVLLVLQCFLCIRI